MREGRPKVLKVFSYSWIVNNLGFFLFVAVLAVVYIGNGHMATNNIREINKLNAEIKDLQFENKTLKSELMYKTREEAIVQMVQPLQLAVPKQPYERIQKLK